MSLKFAETLGIGLLLAFGLIVFFGSPAASLDKDILILSDKNTVSLALPIEGESVKDLSEEFLEKSDKLAAGQDMYLVLNSPGGSITDGLALIELIKGLPRKVHTISMFSASMSFIMSQQLGNRYVLANTTMMSHRAAVDGVGGIVPGSLNSRVANITAETVDLERQTAERAGMNFMSYQNLIANELWMGASDALRMKFADKKVTVRCDKSLRGPGKSHDITLFVFRAKITFDKCPLITTPVAVAGDEYLINLITKNDRVAQVKAFNP